jgi:hypothetical protein
MRAHETVPFLPLATCQLRLRGEPVKANYICKIREAASLPMFFGYKKSKHNWHTQTFQDIQWQAFKKAAGSFRQSSNNSLMKLVYDQLATQYRKTTAGGQTWTSPLCTQCDQSEPETFAHIIRCNHPTAIKFRANFRRQITLHLLESSSFSSAFQHLFLLATDQWLWSQDNPFLTTSDDPTNTITDPLIHQQVATKQTKIGWHLFVRGFISSQWMIYNTQTTIHRDPSRNTHAIYDRVIVRLIQEMWALQLDFWRDYQKA